MKIYAIYFCFIYSVIATILLFRITTEVEYKLKYERELNNKIILSNYVDKTLNDLEQARENEKITYKELANCRKSKNQ